MCLGVIQCFDRKINKENGLLRMGQAENLLIGAPFLSVLTPRCTEVHLSGRERTICLKICSVRGFNASYKHLRIFFGSLRPSTYFGQNRGALNVLRRNTALRQNEVETKAARSERAGCDFIYRGAFFGRPRPLAVRSTASGRGRPICLKICKS